MKKYLYLIFAAGLVAGCDKNDTVPAQSGQETGPLEIITTFAAEPVQNTTFRVMCYDRNNEHFGAGSGGTGTYRYETTRPNSLVPCAVDDNGTPTVDGTDYALHLNTTENQYLILVSPAKKFNMGTVNTFDLDRTKAFWATSAKAFYLSGYRILDFRETLKDLRSRVAFSFYRGANVSSTISVSDLTLTDAGSTAKWVPNTGAITVSGAAPIILMRAATSAEIAAEPALLFVNNAPEYLFASTYGSNGVKTIKVEFDLTVGGSTSHERYILAQTLEKMKYYKFNFTVTSEQITLVLQVFDVGGNVHEWENGITDIGSLGDPESTLNLATWTIGNSWENGGGGSGSIDD